MESEQDTLFPALPSSNNEEIKQEQEELDYDAMFESMLQTDTKPIQANPEDGVLDIRDILGKTGRDTKADNPDVIITEISKEKQNIARSHLPEFVEEAKAPIDFDK